MRSIAFSIILVLTATVLCGLAGWRLINGNLGSLLGVPPTPVGERLYTTFKPDEVRVIRVSTQGGYAEFEKSANGWQMLLPWQDRMDPRAAIAIISFTLGMRVEDSAPVEEVQLQQAGLTQEAVHIRLEGKDGSTLAKYRLGHRSVWQGMDAESAEPVPTVFVQPWDKNRKSHVFTCTGDILSLFKNNLAFLRDHHPFYFLPASLHEIRIRSADGELTLGRKSPQDAWHITKPLDLRTDPAAIKTLIEGLHNLQALTVKDRDAAAKPVPAAAAKTKQIALTFFGSAGEIVLDIHPPETPEARDVTATVSDRPGTVFKLPLKPEHSLVSLADLPLAVNDLRDPTLTNLSIASLQAISIKPATGPEIFITRDGPKRWTTMLDGRDCQANEMRLYELLKAVTAERVIGFESDAATDFTPWGLHRPILKLTFIGHDSTSITLHFGMDKHGTIFVNRVGTSSVMRVDKSLLSAIAIHPYDWRHGRLWSFSRTDLTGIERATPQQAPLKLAYDFIDEPPWHGTLDGRDVSDEIDPASAEYMLGALESLEVFRWLSPADEGAGVALAKPSLTLLVEEKAADDNEAGSVVRHELKFGPQPGASPPKYYYGRLTNDAYPFLLERPVYEKLAVGLLGNK